MSSTDTLFGKLRVEDVPAPDAMPFEALGVVGTVETREVANGKVMVTIPLTYRRDGQVDDRTFYARLFVVPAWFDPTFDPATLEPNDRTNYNITMKQKVRGLFIAAGVKEGELDFRALEGRLVGFRTRQQGNDPSRLEVARFFTPRQ